MFGWNGAETWPERSSNRRVSQEMTAAEKKVVRRRLSVLELPVLSVPDDIHVRAVSRITGAHPREMVSRFDALDILSGFDRVFG